MVSDSYTLRKQDSLLFLIQSLTPNERRYFKLYSNIQPGDKNYLQLFDALENKERYDAAELSKELKRTKRQITDDKYYLTKNLLQSLRNYDSESTQLMQLMNDRENVRILFRRRCFDLALDFADKALERATYLEAFEIVDDLLMLHSRCQIIMSRYARDLNLTRLRHKNNERLQELFAMMEHSNEARKLSGQGAKPGMFDKLLKNPLLKGDVNDLLSLRSKLLYYEVFLCYHQCCFNQQAVVQVNRDERSLFDQHPALKVISPVGYVGNGLRLGSSEVWLGNYEAAIAVLEQVENDLQAGELDLSPQQLLSMQFNAGMFKLWPLRHLERYAEALKLSKVLELQVANRSEPDQYNVLFEHTLTLLLAGRAAEAADKLEGLKRFKAEVRSDMQPYAQMMGVMIQLDLGNYRLLPHLIKTTRWWLKKQGVKYEEFSTFLTHAAALAGKALNRKPDWSKMLEAEQAGKFATMNKLIQFNLWLSRVSKRR